jgi:hypothetical protein
MRKRRRTGSTGSQAQRSLMDEGEQQDAPAAPQEQEQHQQQPPGEGAAALAAMPAPHMESEGDVPSGGPSGVQPHQTPSPVALQPVTNGETRKGSKRSSGKNAASHGKIAGGAGLATSDGTSTLVGPEQGSQLLPQPQQPDPQGGQVPQPQQPDLQGGQVPQPTVTHPQPQPQHTREAKVLLERLVTATDGWLLQPLEGLHAQLSRLAVAQKDNTSRAMVIEAMAATVSSATRVA